MGFNVEIINQIVKIGEIITQPITDKWFYWAMLTFILHHRDWKYANFNIAIFMWVVHSIALMYPKIIAFIYSGSDTNKLQDLQKWRFQDIPPFIFYYLSEIIGDCQTDGCGANENKQNVANFNCFRDSPLWQSYQKLECLNILSIALYYGTCFFILKSTKDEYESQSKLNPSSFTLVKKFRRDSKYRMMFSSLCALVSCGFAIPFVIDTFKHNFDFRLEVTREAIMSLTYYMIYIDQILKSEQSGGQAFRSTTNDPASSTNTKTGFSSKGALDNSKIHDGNDYGNSATPWNNIDSQKGYGGNFNANNYNFNSAYCKDFNPPPKEQDSDEMLSVILDELERARDKIKNGESLSDTDDDEEEDDDSDDSDED
ncbi:hypothetical protein PIROE2DRAFT_70079 [Piromyces sp. E2]|nr:hypothetical protein PIROE2DRAFT_70079 [Piromyces sp. E2]|eukprot:OUM57374.1 hypothetical protein PIROE2DRAFT_70079 [Piromyces sp. E2]